MTSNGKQFTVHQEGAEGTLQVDALTGSILTPLDQRPDWAEGYGVAVLQERIKFYEDRLGKDSQTFKDIIGATTISAGDLAWVGVDSEQEPHEFSASEEHRMDVIATTFGINRDTGDMGVTTAQREVSAQNRGRSQHEINALEESLEAGFNTGDVAHQQKATG
jgi:hypothetical protein